MRPARALLWACPLYVALLAVLFAGDPGGLRWLVAALLAGLVLLALLRGGLLRRRPRVYLSHRRSDSAAEAAGVVAACAAGTAAGPSSSARPAVRFGASLRDEVGHAIGRCDAVCVVIGTDWTTSRDGSGRRRLMNVRDPVRVEVETALHSGRATVPVLVGGAAAPRPGRPAGDDARPGGPPAGHGSRRPGPAHGTRTCSPGWSRRPRGRRPGGATASCSWAWRSR